MIQIYKRDNVDYSSNGDTVLFPESCEISADLNGAWTLTLKHPLDAEGAWKYIEEGAVVAVPSFVSEKQLFRIYSKIKSNEGITANARPVFMDAANEVFLVDVRPTHKNGQDALNEMLRGQSRYKGISDINTISTAYYVRKNLIEALQSDDENSFLNRWGGEILYNNFIVSVNSRIGEDNGARAEMGFNCTGIEESVDTTNLATRLVPVSFNGYTLEGDKPWVDSEKINNYPVIHTKIVEFPDVRLTKDCSEGETGFDTMAALREELKKRCLLEYQNGADLPEVNYKCDFVELREFDIYKDLKGLEGISLGDTVVCKNRRLGIETTARAIRIVYNCIKRRNDKVELGVFSKNYFSDLCSVMKKADEAINNDGTLKGDKVSGIIDGMKARLYAMHSAAQKQDVIAMLFEDTDRKSSTYGAMAMGTCGFMISQEQYPDGTWNWTTFGTGKGFLADCLIAGSVISRNWVENLVGFRLNLDEGTINSKHLKLDTAGLLTIYKALISGGEISVMDNEGNRIFRVSENEGFIFGDGENGAIRYDKADRVLKMYKDTKLYGRITNYSQNNKESVSIGNNRVDVYSWQKDGDYIGSIGSLANADDSDGRQTLGIYSDTRDRVAIGYISGQDAEGKNIVTYLLTIDPTKLGKTSYSDRAIKFREIPEFPGTLTLSNMYIGTTKLSVFNGLLNKVEYGRTFDGTFKSGAGENIKVSNGVIENVT